MEHQWGSSNAPCLSEAGWYFQLGLTLSGSTDFTYLRWAGSMYGSVLHQAFCVGAKSCTAYSSLCLIIMQIHTQSTEGEYITHIHVMTAHGMNYDGGKWILGLVDSALGLETKLTKRVCTCIRLLRIFSDHATVNPLNARDYALDSRYWTWLRQPYWLLEDVFGSCNKPTFTIILGTV